MNNNKRLYYENKKVDTFTGREKIDLFDNPRFNVGDIVYRKWDKVIKIFFYDDWYEKNFHHHTNKFTEGSESEGHRWIYEIIPDDEPVRETNKHDARFESRLRKI
jgi:hypothetical protein